MDNVWIFFYGTFMSAKVLRDYGIACQTTVPAKLAGYELSIRPRVNLKKSDKSICYGGLAHISHRDISLLYDDLDSKFGINYYPYPVDVEMNDGAVRPALCYISFNIKDADPDPAYIDAMARCAAELKAPRDYIQHINSFRQDGSG